MRETFWRTNFIFTLFFFQATIRPGTNDMSKYINKYSRIHSKAYTQTHTYIICSPRPVMYIIVKKNRGFRSDNNKSVLKADRFQNAPNWIFQQAKQRRFCGGGRWITRCRRRRSAGGGGGGKMRRRVAAPQRMTMDDKSCPSPTFHYCNAVGATRIHK